MRLTALSESTFGARSSVVTREIPGNPVSVAPIESMKSRLKRDVAVKF